MSRWVPLDRPWEAPQAAEWDRQTLADWLETQLGADELAKTILATTICSPFEVEPSELSLLHALYLIQSHKYNAACEPRRRTSSS